ncbi:MAG: gfo/Idh/MocA family oxidoreductase [Chloroflexi bacterium]|nr:MAG: gfo/Idh/MocA family oxidoreductase [Chloroflexota bacterium]
MADTLRIGLIGAGENTRVRHIPGFQAIEGVEIVAVCNRSTESGDRVADQFGIGRVETDPEALFSDPTIDAIAIGTWPYRHREFVVRALDAGKHVLTEARMAMNATEAREMLDASRRRPDLVAQVVPAPFDLRSWRTVRRLVAEGALGDIREVHVSIFNGAATDPSTPAHWREQTVYSGANVMMFGIYAEIVSRWLGPTARLVANGTTFLTSRVDAANGQRTTLDVPDSLGVLSTLVSGTRVTYRFTAHALTAVPGANTIVVFGSLGTLLWEFAGDRLQFAPAGSTLQPLEPDAGTEGTWHVEQDFVDSIREGMPVTLTNFEDGLHYMQIIEAAQRSRLTGRAVDVSEV